MLIATRWSVPLLLVFAALAFQYGSGAVPWPIDHPGSESESSISAKSRPNLSQRYFPNQATSVPQSPPPHPPQQPITTSERSRLHRQGEPHAEHIRDLLEQIEKSSHRLAAKKERLAAYGWQLGAAEHREREIELELLEGRLDMLRHKELPLTARFRDIGLKIGAFQHSELTVPGSQRAAREDHRNGETGTTEAQHGESMQTRRGIKRVRATDMLDRMGGGHEPQGTPGPHKRQRTDALQGRTRTQDSQRAVASSKRKSRSV